VDVAVFEAADDAKTVEFFLMKKRLEARTYRERFFYVFMFLHPPRATHQVQVRHNSLKFAGEVLDAAAPEAMQRAIRCPACNSLRVTYPQLTRPSILSTIRLHLGLIFHVIEHECCCQRCHRRWNLPRENVNPAPESASDTQASHGAFGAKARG
jgi:hypothetical protein